MTSFTIYDAGLTKLIPDFECRLGDDSFPDRGGVWRRGGGRFCPGPEIIRRPDRRIAEIADGAPEAELFEPDDWAGLTDALARWIKEGHPFAAGAAAIMRQRYHPEVYLRQHLQVYDEVLSAWRR